MMNRREALSRVAIIMGGTVLGAEAFLSGCATKPTGLQFTKDLTYRMGGQVAMLILLKFLKLKMIILKLKSLIFLIQMSFQVQPIKSKLQQKCITA